MTATSASDRLAELEVRMRELQVKRLEAVIRAKEARLQALRGGRGPEAENYPPNDVPPPVVEVPPPPVRRQSSELINIEQATPNDAPLGKLQVAGRSDYTATLPMPAFGLHGIRRDSSQDRGGLQPSGLPAELVARWCRAAASMEDVLHEILESVSRAGCGTVPAPLRELASMTQQWSADKMAVLGGPLGGMSGGLPTLADGVDLTPLRAFLEQEKEVVLVQSLQLFTRELLTGAETEAGSTLADRPRLQQDLKKLSAEELNLAFRRACLKEHPGRPGGSLAALLRVHFLFELLVVEWTGLVPAGHGSPPRGGGGTPDKERAPAERAAAHAAPMHDSLLLREWAMSEAELVAETEGMGDEAIEAVNAQMQAQAMYMCRMRDLLDEQLEAYQAIGAYAIIGCEPDVCDKDVVSAYREAAKRLHPDRGGDKESFQRLQSAYSQVVTARKASNGSFGESVGEGGAKAGRGRRGSKGGRGAKGGKGADKKSAAGGDAAGGGTAAEGSHEGEGEGGGKGGGGDEGGGEGGGEEEEGKGGGAKADAEGAASREGAADIPAQIADPDATKPEDWDDEDDGEWEPPLIDNPEFKEAATAAEEEGAEEQEQEERKGHDDDAAAAGATEEGEVSDGEVEPPVPPPMKGAAAAAAAAAAEAEGGLGDVAEEAEAMGAEEMCKAAEAAAEAARACAASARIGRRVAALGGGGWEVLCDCAQCVLRCSKSAALKSAAVGSAAMDAPSISSAALDAAAGRRLGRKGERELRALTEALMAAVRQARCAVLASSVCASKSSDAAGLVMSLAQLPPAEEAMRSAAGAASLSSLMVRVAEVLADMSAAVGEAAEHAMSTAVAVAEMERQAAVVKALAAQAEVIDSDDEDEDDKPPEKDAAAKAAEKAAAAEARAAEEAAEKEGPPLSAAAKRRVENARWLRKVSGELCESQAQIIRLVSATPQLLPRVSVPKKESVFEQVAALLDTALRPIERDWYERGLRADGTAATAALGEGDGGGGGGGGGGEGGGDGEDDKGGDAHVVAWVALVREQVEFLFHAAQPAGLPVPSARAARVMRLAAFLDVELTSTLLRTQLLHKLQLFVPDRRAADPHSGHAAVLELQQSIEAAIAKLAAHCAPEVARPPRAATAAEAQA